MKLPCGCDIEGTSFCAVGGTLQMYLDHETERERSARGDAVVERLMAPDADRIVAAMHAAVVRMRQETIEEVLEVIRVASVYKSCGGCSTTPETDCYGHLTITMPTSELVARIRALLPHDDDQPIPYALTEAGMAATEPVPETLPSGELGKEGAA